MLRTRAALTLGVLAGLLLALPACQNPPQSREVGVIGNDGSGEIAVFDPASSSLGGTLAVPSRRSSDVYALAVPSLGNRVYVSDRRGEIHPVSLSGSTPSSGGSAFSASTTAFDIDMVDDNPLMLISVGTDPNTSAQVAVAATQLVNGRAIASVTLGNGVAHTVDVCDDRETVLVGTSSPEAVHKLTVDGQGQLTRTGMQFSVQNPVANVHCAPGSAAGVVVSSAGATIQSFEIGSMSGVHTRDLAAVSASGSPGFDPVGQSGVFSPSGDRFFARSERGDFTGDGFVEAFEFDPASGTLTATGQQASVAPFGSASRGTGEIAINGDGTRLFVTDRSNDGVLVLDPSSLSNLSTITGPDIDAPFTVLVGGTN
jgi:YVTN family beta-propeller protein